MMQARSLVVAVMAFAAGAGHVQGAPTTTVVDVPTRDVTQRFLYVRPEAPVANIVFLPGSTGILGIENDGAMPTLPGRCAPFARNRDAFAARGFALALVDRTSDGKVRQFVDVREVVRYVRARDHIPTWIVGGSASTTAALDFAVESAKDEPLGVIVYSPWKPDLARAAPVKRPTLLLYHREDAGSEPFVDPLFDALAAAPARERIALDGGTSADECGGYHLFRGIDDAFVAAVAGFIIRHNAFSPRRKSQ
jgi:hypothetical protein